MGLDMRRAETCMYLYFEGNSRAGHRLMRPDFLRKSESTYNGKVTKQKEKNRLKLRAALNQSNPKSVNGRKGTKEREDNH